MLEEKKWYQSKAVWGGLIVVASSLAGLWGIGIDAVTQDNLSDLLVALSTTIGGLVAVYGRIKASRIIK